MLKRSWRALSGRGWPALRRPFESLPSRISLWAFAATFITSLVVTTVSRETTEGFLRDKIDQKFPGILRGTSQRLELWYSQRQLEIETFGRSTTVVENLPRIRKQADPRLRAEVEQYLTYVLERFPQYRALFALDEAGQPLLWVGSDPHLPEALARRLASVNDSQISDVYRLGEARMQVASAPIRNHAGERLASLHALVEIDALETTLATDELGASGGIYVVSREGASLMRSPGSPARLRRARPLPPPGAAGVVEDYTNESGERVVGSALAFERFGWTIIVEEPAEQAFAPAVEVVTRALGVNLVVVLVFSLVTFQIARSLLKPIVALSAGASRIAKGDSDVAIPVSHRQDEIGQLTRAIKEMRDQLVGQNHELKRANEQLEQLSVTDGLTQLHNHRFFQDHLPREMKRAKRTREPLALILIDIDDFKKLNDRYGHAVGDAVLRRVAAVMNEQVREMDLLARYGGEEFALLASGTDLGGAESLAEKIREAISRARFPVDGSEDGETVSITVSIGIAAFRGDEKALFNEADEALYRAKGNGKDCVFAMGADSVPA